MNDKEKPKVLNKYTASYEERQNAVNIMRPSKWGNPWAIGKNGATREQVITNYKHWLLNHPEMIAMAKAELKGKDLLCCCAPRPCHGDVLLEVANAE